MSDPFLGALALDKFRLHAVVLQGVHGVVYAAEQFFCRAFVRPALVKISRQAGLTDLNAPALCADLLRLAAAPAGLGHPAVLDFGIAADWDRRCLVATSACEGTPWLDQPGEPLELFFQACAAVASLHRVGAVHGDLRPEALLWTQAGQACCTGAGFACGSDVAAYLADVPAEALPWIAPEALLRPATPAADVYSLGLLLFQRLTGGGPHLLAPWRRAQLGGPAEVARLKAELRFLPPSASVAEIRQRRPWLDQVIERCLDADPGRRFADADELLQALEAGAAGQPLPQPGQPRLRKTPPQAPPPRLGESPHDERLRAARALLARGETQAAIDQLDIHRPAEWNTLDAPAAALLRILGQAYVRQKNWPAARECLEHLQSALRETPHLPPAQKAAALTDLRRCYEALGLSEQAKKIEEEARGVGQ